MNRRQVGSVPVDLVLGAPLLAVLISLVIWAGTGGQTPNEVSVAAHDAARLASTIRTPADRPDAAQRLVDDRLAGSACADWAVTTVSSPSTVTVTVGCTLDTPQMAGLRLGSREVSVTGRATLDRFFLGSEGSGS